MDQRIRIAFDAKRFFSNSTGLGNYSRWLIRLLAKNERIETVLYSPDPSHKSAEFETHNSGSKWRFRQDIWRNKTLSKQAVKDSIAIYHGLSNELPLGIGKTGIKTVLTIHDCIQKRFPEQYSFIDRAIYNRKIEYAQRIADRIVCPSEQTKTDLVRFFRTDAEKIHVIPIGTGILDIIKEGFGSYKNDRPFILCVSSFTERKNLIRLAKAYKKSKLATEVDLIIAGKKGPVLTRLKMMAESTKGLNLITDPDEETLNALYKACTFTVYPSLFEGFGIPVLEAFVHGKTVVTSGVSSLPEVGGACATYFEPEDEESIRMAMENMWYSSGQRQHHVSLIAGQLERFNDSGIAEAYLKLYTSLL